LSILFISVAFLNPEKVQKNTKSNIIGGYKYRFVKNIGKFCFLMRFIMKKIILAFITLLTLVGSANAQLGSLSSDLVFTPVTPCRLVDTRTIYGGTGPILTNSTRGFGVWGYTSYAAQGGSPTNCGLTAGKNTAAVAVSMAVVSPAGQGYLTAFPGDVADASRPLAATLNYNAGEVVVSGAAILKVNQGSATPDLKIYSSTTTEVIIDVVGYYSKPVATALTCMTTTAVSSPVASPSGSGLYYGFAIPAACPAGTTELSMRCTTNNALVTASIYDSTGNLDSEQCVGQSPVNGYLLRANRVCCNLPGR
jgi:hypothetical protein